LHDVEDITVSTKDVIHVADDLSNDVEDVSDDVPDIKNFVPDIRKDAPEMPKPSKMTKLTGIPSKWPSATTRLTMSPTNRTRNWLRFRLN
jgi:hypothetical protein